MIKFFRKIRQNLLSEGQTGKYLKYAVGEIILVVLGILIALQINNWNERNKQEKYIKSLFLGVKQDLLNDIEEADLYLDFIREYDTITQNIFNGKYTSEDYTNPKNYNYFFAGITSYSFAQSNQSFEVLNGKKEMVPDEYTDLMKSLARVYVERAEILKINLEVLNERVNNYTKYLHDNFDWVIDLRNRKTTEEMINYQLNNSKHKRQLALWSLSANETSRHVSRIKRDAIINSFIIHNLFSPEQELPDLLDEFKFIFSKNKIDDYLGLYIDRASEMEHVIYSKYGLLFWNIPNRTTIYGEAPITEIDKDSVGMAFNETFTMALKRDSTGVVNGIKGYRSEQKVLDLEKLN